MSAAFTEESQCDFLSLGKNKDHTDAHKDVSLGFFLHGSQIFSTISGPSLIYTGSHHGKELTKVKGSQRDDSVSKNACFSSMRT